MRKADSRELDTVDATDLAVTERRSGRAVWDDRGNSTWEWQVEPGVFSRDIDTMRLKTLGEHLQIDEHAAPHGRPGHGHVHGHLHGHGHPRHRR